MAILFSGKRSSRNDTFTLSLEALEEERALWSLCFPDLPNRIRTKTRSDSWSRAWDNEGFGFPDTLSLLRLLRTKEISSLGPSCR